MKNRDEKLKRKGIIKKARENRRMESETNLMYRGKCLDP
jgi:hypothetical protein